MKTIALISLLLFVSLGVIGCTNDKDKTSNDSKIFQEKFNCPDGSIAEVDNWGKSGRSRSCKLKHGKFIGWENGRKVYEAHYKLGRLVGESYWYDTDGNITKVVKSKAID